MDQLKRTIELDPGAPMPDWFLGWVYDAKGMYREALAEFEKIGVKATSDDQGDIMAIGQVYAHAGNHAEALMALERLETLARADKPSSEAFAALNVALHRPDEAFAWLEEAYKDHQGWLSFLRSAPEWAPLRKDPRFADLARRVGIPEPSQGQR
jgi:tetratricopeptide (TPR) repeat protein